MKIQPYEEIKRFDSIGLVVTNRRVRYEVQDKICQSMSLASVSSISLAYRDTPILWKIALVTSLAIVYGVLENESELTFVGLVVTIVFIILYWFSRRNVLAIYGSGNDRILVTIQKSSYKTAREVLDYVEDLKLKLE